MKHALLVGNGIVLGILATLLVGNARVSEATPQAGPGPGGAVSSPGIVLGTGGASSQNDLCWVVTKVKPAKGPERTVLAMYRAMQQGAYFDLCDVRMIDADLRIIDFRQKARVRNQTDVMTILKNLPPAERNAIMPPKK